jgi:hypothetical protein
VLTWTQLGVHRKPCAVLDPTGFFDPLFAQVDRAVAERFVRPEHRGLLLRATTVDGLLDAMAAWQPSHDEKWLDRLDRLDR